MDHIERAAEVLGTGYGLWTIGLSRSNETRWFKAPSENKAYEIVRTLLAEKKAGEDVIRISVFVDDGLGSGPELFERFDDNKGWT